MPRDNTISFSKHAAKTPQGYWFMAIVEPLVVPAFFCFIAFWLVPTLRLSSLFTILGLAGTVGFLLAAWVPDRPGRSNIFHEIASYGAALTLIPASFILLITSSITAPGRVASGVALIFMLASLVDYFLIKRLHAYYLPLQATYILPYHLAILTHAFIR